MSPCGTRSRPPGCDDVAELLAWHANGTLGPDDRELVESHTEICRACRTSLALERRIVEAMRASRDNVELSPHAAWQKLAPRLESGSRPGDEAAGVPAAADQEPAAPHNSAARERERVSAPANEPPRRAAWPMWAGIALAAQAAAIAVLAVALVRHRQLEVAPRFHTLSSPDPTLADGRQLVRIAFEPGVSEAVAQSVAAGAAARIIAGPSPDNVYTFAFQSDRAGSTAALEEKIGRLRRQAHVLLVEPVVVGPPRPGR